jgi:hypothetical protein
MKYMIIEDSKHNYYIINNEDNPHIYAGTVIVATCEDLNDARMIINALNN